LSYLIDTNVLSELRRKTPDANVMKWVNSWPATSLYLSVLTLGELRKGIDSLLGATAAHHGLTMVTRNSKDFDNLGLEVLNPWND
jgi:predicted nucleic acid-binding protein